MGTLSTPDASTFAVEVSDSQPTRGLREGLDIKCRIPTDLYRLLSDGGEPPPINARTSIRVAV